MKYCLLVSNLGAGTTGERMLKGADNNTRPITAATRQCAGVLPGPERRVKPTVATPRISEGEGWHPDYG